MNDVLKNAIISIQIGIEDFQSNDKRRPVSALRNFYAGVLLLGKQCLLNAAPPGTDPMDILASKFAPSLDSSGELVYGPKGRQTIDLSELRERFRGFNLEWPEGEITVLQKLRNDFEHYHSSAPREAIRQAISSCFPIVEGFFNILELSPRMELGETWDIMISEKKFFEKLKAECNLSFQKMPWAIGDGPLDRAECPDCRSSLISQRDPENDQPESIEGVCKSCGTVLSAEQTVEVLIQSIFGYYDYLVAKDGGEAIINYCPECHNNTYVEYDAIHKCYLCGYRIDSECARCGSPLSVSSMSVNNSSLCDYCDHMSSKDD